MCTGVIRLNYIVTLEHLIHESIHYEIVILKLNLMQQDHTIILSIYNDVVEANIAQEKLKANGIDSFLEDENVMGLNPLGGIELKIFSKDKEAAEKILSG